MKIEELIKELKACDPQAEVKVCFEGEMESGEIIHVDRYTETKTVYLEYRDEEDE